MLRSIIDFVFRTSNSNTIFLYLILLLLPASVLIIGDFDRQLMIQDSSTSGPYSSYLIMFSDQYSDDIMRFITNMGYLSPLVLIQNFLYTVLGINPELTSYIFVIFGGLFFCCCMLFFAKSFGIDNQLSLLISIMTISFVILDINLAKFGPGTTLQVFPDMNFYAYGIVCLILGSVLRNNFFKANVLLVILSLVHLGHALLTLPILATIYFYRITKRKLDMKEGISNLIFLFIIAILILLISFFVRTPGESNSHEYIWHIINGRVGGHTFAWENGEFISILSNYLIAFPLLYISIQSIKNSDSFTINKNLYSEFIEVFYILVFVLCLYLTLDIFMLNFPIYELIQYIQLHPLRATNYLQLFIFPIFAFYLLTNILSPSSPLTLKVLSVMFLIFGIAFKSIALWVLVPFFIYFDKNLIVKKRASISLITFLFIYICLALYLSSSFLGIDAPLAFVLDQGILFIFNPTNYINLPNFILFKIVAAFVILFLAFTFIYKYLTHNVKITKYMSKYILLSSILLSSVYLESINWFAGSIWFNKHEKPKLELLYWMKESSNPSAKFMTIDRHIQMNGISNRATFRPYPFFAEMYRANSIETKHFSEEILDFWNIDIDETHGWFEEGSNQIYSKYNDLSKKQVLILRDKFKFDFMITSTGSSTLDFEEAYKNTDYIIYIVK